MLPSASACSSTVFFCLVIADALDCSSDQAACSPAYLLPSALLSGNFPTLISAFSSACWIFGFTTFDHTLSPAALAPAVAAAAGPPGAALTAPISASLSTWPAAEV